VIGASIPLTGPLAGFGYFEKWGYQHAVNLANAAGGNQDRRSEAQGQADHS